MGTMKDAVYAATLMMFLEKERIDGPMIRRITEALAKKGPLNQGIQTALMGGEHADWLTNMFDQVAAGRWWQLEVFWSPAPAAGPAPPAGSIVQYSMDTQNPDKLAIEGLACIRVYVGANHMPPMTGPRTGILVERFKEVVKMVQPRFALLDTHQDVIAKRKGKDPRRFAWGAAYYDADQVAAIGSNTVRMSSPIIKEEWPNVGFRLKA